MSDINQFIVTELSSIRDALKIMDEGGQDFCVCVDDKLKVVGVITDGDFRRAVHHGIQLDENISRIVNRNFYFVNKDYTKEEIETIFNNTLVRQIPVLEDGVLAGIVSMDKFYGEDRSKKHRILDNPVVIMAGGKGTRLDPFTRILPKPLIPLGNDPVIKVIMDEFYKFGISNFHISLQDKGRMVRAYFHEHQLGYQIEFIHEDEPLGTVGALRQLEGKMKDSFFVSNCDIIIRTDYGAFYDFHTSGNYAMTIVGSMRHYTIPYGICEMDTGGTLKSIHEKPQYDFLVNTGMYLLQPKVLEYIPENVYFNMTDLIQEVQKKGLKVGIFPVSEKSWIDVGQLSEYKEIIKKLNLPI